MAEEGPSGTLSPSANGGPNGPSSVQESGTRYEVGPGFEIAIRAALNRPVEVNVRNEGDGSRRPEKSGDHDHRHDAIEKRLDAIERALFIVVDHLKRIDESRAPGAMRSIQGEKP